MFSLFGVSLRSQLARPCLVICCNLPSTQISYFAFSFIYNPLLHNPVDSILYNVAILSHKQSTSPSLLFHAMHTCSKIEPLHQYRSLPHSIQPFKKI